MYELTVWYHNGKSHSREDASRFATQRYCNVVSEIRDQGMHGDVYAVTLHCLECGKTVASYEQESLGAEWEETCPMVYGHYESCEAEVSARQFARELLVSESGVFGFNGREYYDLEPVERHVPSEY